MDPTLRHLPRPGPHCNGQQSWAPRLERRPDPRASRRQPLAGGGCTACARLDAPPPGLYRVEWPLRAGHVAATITRKDLQWLGRCHPPVQHRVRGDRAHAGGSAPAHACGPACQPPDEPLHRQALFSVDKRGTGPFYCAFLPFYEMLWSCMEIS
jgi:hypothetical protein